MLRSILAMTLILSAHFAMAEDNEIENLIMTDEQITPLGAAILTGDLQSTNIVTRNTVTSNTRTNIVTSNTVTSNTRTNIVTSNTVTSNTRTNIITPNTVTSNTRTAIVTANTVTSGGVFLPASEWLKPEVTLPEPEVETEVQQ